MRDFINVEKLDVSEGYFVGKYDDYDVVFVVFFCLFKGMLVSVGGFNVILKGFYFVVVLFF